MGLAAALRSLRDQMEGMIPIEMEIAPEVSSIDVPGSSSIPEQVRLGLYRVAEEAMANVLKHSGATGAAIRLRVGPKSEALCLSIQDNGQGFDAGAVTRGLGLTTIDDYLGAMGGTYKLETAPGKGTIITATIPITHPLSGEEEKPEG